MLGADMEPRVDKYLDEATGRNVPKKKGGPLANFQLTATLGLTMLALILVQIWTTTDLHRLMDWHVVVGTIITVPLLAKTIATGYKMASYYLHRNHYAQEGPPLTLFRVLSPLLLLVFWIIIASGVLMLLDGENRHVFGIALHTWHTTGWVLLLVLLVVHLAGRLGPALRGAWGLLRNSGSTGNSSAKVAGGEAASGEAHRSKRGFGRLRAGVTLVLVVVVVGGAGAGIWASHHDSKLIAQQQSQQFQGLGPVRPSAQP
jgi:hypothetical protein